MPDAELPLLLCSGNEGTKGEPTTELDLALSASLRGWVPALTLWSAIDEDRHHLTSRCLSDGSADDWTAFRTAASEVALVEPGPEPGTLRFRHEWASALALGLDRLGGPDALQARLVDCWVPEVDSPIAPEMAAWAVALARWDVVEAAWIQLNVHPDLLTLELLELFADLPTQARAARPLLTWASGMAGAALAGPERRGPEGVPEGVLLDAAILHANWSQREDTDTAVNAGTMRMLGERRQPATHPGQALEAAWRTKQDLDAFLDARSREGRGAGRKPQAVFRAFSAQLALCRANYSEAINEARWAAFLADVEPVKVMAQGLEALAVTLSVEDGPAQRAKPEIEELDAPLGVRGMRGRGQAYWALAGGIGAMRRLDRAVLDRALALLSSEDAAFVGVWAVRAGVEGLRNALWGDLGEGIERLAAEIDRRSRFGNEQDETLGAAMLGRARIMLLTKSGAFGAVSRTIDALPEGFRLLPLARAHLWAGQFEEAIRVADSGAYAEGVARRDRPQLLFVKAAAALLHHTCDAELKAIAITEFRHQLEVENYIPIAAVPNPARKAILELCAPELSGEPNYPVMLDRLSELNDAGDRGLRPTRLTEREHVLLPLLATDVAVPEIARKLQVSVNTVRKQVVTLREKFGADSRAELIRKARAYGAIP
jgi:DNA-binding CsgD family transcriptional regulator